jgi:hypothetical protein
MHVKTLKRDNASTLLKLQRKKTKCKGMLGKDRAGKIIFQQSLQNQGLTPRKPLWGRKPNKASSI